MPRVARAAIEVNGVKDRILEAALQLLIDDGFVHFSMRKLAARLGMTAANIYNYVNNKDELYLLIQTRGFEMLYDSLHEAYEKTRSPEKRMEAMIRSYLEFGIGNPEYYEIMFSRNTPKYVDYAGTEIEPVAFHEKQVALKSAEITLQALSDIFGQNGAADANGIRFLMLDVWCTLNGIVNLHNSRVLQEVEMNADIVIDGMVRNLMKTVMGSREERS